MAPKPPTGRCAQCGEPHRYDDRRGYRHADGHPYQPPSDTPPKLTVVGKDVRLGAGIPDGYEYAVMGGFYRCTRCRALLERHDPEVAAHSEHHDAVDRALAEAWRLLNGGGAA